MPQRWLFGDLRSSDGGNRTLRPPWAFCGAASAAASLWRSDLALSLKTSSLLGLGTVIILVGSVIQLTKQALKCDAAEGWKRWEGRAWHE